MKTTRLLILIPMGLLICAGCSTLDTLKTGVASIASLPGAATHAVVPTDAARQRAESEQQLEERKERIKAEQEARRKERESRYFVRVAAPKPETVKPAWTAGSPIAKGSPEAVVENLVKAIANDKEKDILAAIAEDGQDSSIKEDLSDFLQNVTFLKQGGAKVEGKLLSSRHSGTDYAEVDSEFVFLKKLGEKESSKYTCICKPINGEWKVTSLVNGLPNTCINSMRVLAAELEPLLGVGEKEDADVANICREETCPFANGRPYIVKIDREKKTFSIACPCANLHPDHYLPEDKERQELMKKLQAVTMGEDVDEDEPQSKPEAAAAQDKDELVVIQ